VKGGGTNRYSSTAALYQPLKTNDYRLFQRGGHFSDQVLQNPHFVKLSRLKTPKAGGIIQKIDKQPVFTPISPSNNPPRGDKFSAQDPQTDSPEGKIVNLRRTLDKT
ncbi:MAG TPA: hypothetical protein VHP83_24930, partial [Aggregatilineaceae bacterium]|nr:hypothetical protein [Aggregatilineaceae bacterium]